ncbi:MAG TPA: hypothetical protein VIS76_09355 [Pseudomonadales bacterium]
MSDTDEVHRTFSSKLRPAGVEQVKVVREAFRMAPPLLCQAVQRVAFVEDSSRRSVSGRNKSNDRQDLLYLNTASPEFSETVLRSSERARYEAMHTVLHEATHAASRLLYSQSNASPPALLEWQPDADLWSGEAQRLAAEAVRDMRLEGGLFQEWHRMHEGFRRAGLADGYYGDEWTGVLAQAPGFATAYGGEDVAEDIAEIVSWALISSRFTAALAGEAYPAQNQACSGMRKEPGPAIPGRLAAVYTKLGFARSVGLITDEAYEACVGRLQVRGDGNGFFSFEGGREVNRYISDVRGRIGQVDDDGGWVFEMIADGGVDVEDKGGRSAEIRLTLAIGEGADRIDDVSFPRGLYKIGPGENPFNSLQIKYREGGEEKLAMEIWEADVLISRASHQLVEGGVFVRKLINHTELLKVPVPPKESRLITFRKRN